MTDGAGQSARLRLLARDAEGLNVLSACLQDAILPIGDMSYAPADRRFVVVANRFRWESAEDAEGGFERVHCGVTFEGVNAVRLRNIDRRDRSLMLSLLALSPSPLPDGMAITLVCAGNRDIRVETDAIAVRLEDYDAAWPTGNRPRHDLDGTT